MSEIPNEPQGEAVPPNEHPAPDIRPLGSDFFDEPVEIEGVEPFESSLISAVNNVHFSQEAVLEAFMTHLAELPESTTDDINTLLGLLKGYHVKLLNELFSSQDIETAVNDYASCIYALNKNFSEELGLISSENGFGTFYMSHDELVSELWDCYEMFDTTNDFIEHLSQSFDDIRGGSLQTVLEAYLSNGHGIDNVETRSSRKLFIRKIASQLGKVAGSAVAIAAGVAGGLVAAHKILNRK